MYLIGLGGSVVGAEDGLILSDELGFGRGVGDKVDLGEL